MLDFDRRQAHLVALLDEYHRLRHQAADIADRIIVVADEIAALDRQLEDPTPADPARLPRRPPGLPPPNWSGPQ